MSRLHAATIYFMWQYLLLNLKSSNFSKTEGALNHVEITVKQKMYFLPYKFDLINSLMKIEGYTGSNMNNSILVFWSLGRKLFLSRHLKSIGPCLNNFTKIILSFIETWNFDLWQDWNEKRIV